MPLTRLATLGPRLALGLAGQLRRGAVANARGASSALTERVAQRRRLAPAQEPTGEPGSLSSIDREQCLALLATRRVGRLAYAPRPDVPDIVTVNYAVDGSDVLIRSGVGPKLAAAERGAVLALQVDDLDEQQRTGWSVVAVGPARRLSVAEHRAVAETVLPDTWAAGPRDAVIRLSPTRVTGRRLG